MFPIPWNFPLRKKNGNLVNIGDAIDEGTELPEHGEGDAGKVLSVDENGNLEWSDEISSEIQTLTNKLNGEVETRAKLSAHNLFDLNLELIKANNTSGTWNDNAYTINGITFTINSDKTVNVDTNGGTASANTTFIIDGDSWGQSFTDCIVSGCPASGSSDTYRIAVNDGGWQTGDTGNGYYSSGTVIALGIWVKSGQTLSNVVFKPMVRTKSDPSDKFTPYAMTNRELTEKAIGSIDSTQITTITTAGGSWTATENCWLQANITPPANDGRMAYVRINDVTVITIGGQSEETPLSVGMAFPVFKGDVITTRDIGTYNLIFYKMS